MIEQRNLEILLDSHFPIIVIATQEELRALELLKNIVTAKGDGFYTWTVAQGLMVVVRGRETTRRFDNLTLQEAIRCRQIPPASRIQCSPLSGTT